MAINDHARRVRPVDEAHGKARIVATDGVLPDNHGIDQGATSMQMRQTLRARNIARVARRRRHAPVQRLADLRQNESPRGGGDGPV